MTDSLSAEQRTKLDRLIGRARRLLEGDLVAQAAGPYGIDADGTIADESTLRLDSSRLSDRREIVEVVEHLRSEGDSPSEAVARLIREAVFTHLNRLVAIRIAEALGLLPESLAQGERSQGYRDIKELAPLLAADETNGYWIYIQICGDELASGVPNLFDPRNPLLALAPSPAALRDLVELFADTGVYDIWTAPDCLGWAYQFFNRAEERKRIHEAGAPSDARELAIANQFFTPRYVVDFLIQNSLGRRLLEADPASPLGDDLPLLINAPTHPGPVLELSDVSVLDPACGSGHFLVGAYDLLERSWSLAGVPPAEAAPNILRALWGIDIDARCTQVAAAALIFRARRSAPTTELPRPNIICARALPPTASHLDDLLASLPETRRELVRELIDTLGDAPVLGPLLKVEERISAQARAGAFGVRTDEGSLADALPIEALAEVESDLLTAVAQVADAATASPAERLLAAEADDAVRFIAAMQRRYTVVLMNPPFGAPVASTKPYLKATYPWIPSTSDLFALFVGRGLELCSSDGYVGAITSRAGMFLSSFEDWRRTILLDHELPALADLGEGVMEQAMVEAAAYVLSKRRRQPHTPSVFVRAVTAKDRASVLRRASQSLRSGHEDEGIFRPDLDRLTKISGAPIPYWVDPESIDVVARHKPFEPEHGLVRQGLATGDDFQFVRAWWEVAPSRRTRPPSDAGAEEKVQLDKGAKWVPIVKGGASQPWFSPVLLVVDWERDGERLRAFGGAVLRNTEFYFRPGFSWTRRAPRLVPYLVPAGCIPSVSRYQAFPRGDPSAAVGLVGSNVASAYVRFYGEKFLWPNFLVDNVKTLPVPEIDEELAAALAQRVRDGVDERRAVYKHLEPYREFTVPVKDVGSLKWNPGSLLGDNLEHRVAAAYGLAPEQAAQLELDMREALQTLGMLESEVEGDDEDLGAIPAWEERMLSYLVGLSFGRWDIRIALNPGCAPPLPDPFDPLPANPPGRLVGEDGLPAQAAPPGYPLELPPAGLLIDSAGDSWDIEARILQAASELFDDPDVECERFAASLGRRSLRQYVRKQFFKDHLRTYSKGRRKAPIYWPLYVPSGEWGVWVYAPSFTRETLFAIESAATARLDAAEAEIGRLRRDQQNGGGGRSPRELANALEAEERLAEELRSFGREAARIAALGWEPDLDDGIVLCAAPLAKLFPAWKDAARERENIKAGKYPWAGVSKWADGL